jgi:murein DD-endopeptidase MepM/ murein hydrolase activator NlpD
MLMAAYRGRDAVITALAALGVTVNERMADGVTPLTMAAEMAALRPGNFDGSGGFISWPTTYRNVTSPFNPGRGCVAGQCYPHTGTDFGAPCGAPIYAAADGEVFKETTAGAGGAWIIGLDHGTSEGTAWATQYWHLSGFAVSQGQWVTRGQVIGFVGTTGYSTGCHLHFEVWRNGVAINAMTVL